MDKLRWRYGDTNPVVAAVDAKTAIEVGDLLWQDVDDAKPASMLPEPGPECGNLPTGPWMREEFADKFLGVAMQRSRLGDSDPIRVACTGVFEFDCPACTFELGNLVGAGSNAAGARLLNQQVARVGASKYAIGRVAKRSADPTTSVLVDIRSTVMTGGVRGTTASDE